MEIIVMWKGKLLITMKINSIDIIFSEMIIV